MKSNKPSDFSLFLQISKISYSTLSSIHFMVSVLNQNGFLRVRRAGREHGCPSRTDLCSCQAVDSPALGPGGMAPPGCLQADPLSHILSLSVPHWSQDMVRQGWCSNPTTCSHLRTRGSNFYLGRTKRCRGQVGRKNAFKLIQRGASLVAQW